MNDNRTVKIILDGGCLSTEQLIAELQACIPSQSSWNWNVRVVENDFIVTLPSADDLERVIRYGGFFIKEKKIHLNFEVWSEEQEGLLLLKIWIRILKVPSKLR